MPLKPSRNNLEQMPIPGSAKDRRDWEKHLRIERWLTNRALKKENGEWKALLREEAEKDKRYFEAVAKALGAPLDFVGELPWGGIADDDEALESFL